MTNTESLNIGKKRGSLTIYIGYSPGVGKTFEMLSNAIDLYQNGVDIKIGYIEPHQRRETEALAKKLPKITTKITNHGSHRVQYLNIDCIIEEAPTIVLIDELAHTNISRERHEKRYMDIEEILNHGIDVHTTLNIQHIESLSSQIELMTGVQVKERVPDYFIIGADVLEVVDISPNQLIKRLKAGKVYKKDRLEVAFSNFFTYEHLSELRTLTLRTVADLMSDKENLCHNHKSIMTPHIAVAISGSIYNEAVIKEAFHIAQKEHAKFTAIYIDIFEKNRQHYDSQKHVHRHLMLAKSLGAKVKVVYSQSVASGLDEWCKNQNVTKLIIGQHIRNKWVDFFNTPLIDRLMSFDHHYKIEIVPIKQISVALNTNKIPYRPKSKRFAIDMLKMLLIQMICILMGIWVYELEKHESSTIILMLFLIGIILVSIWTQSYMVGFLAAILNVFVFNYFFTEPRFTFEVYRFDYPITFIVSILTSLLTSALLKQIKFQYSITKKQLYRTDLLLQFNDSIKQTYTVKDLLVNAGHQIHQLLQQSITIYVIDNSKVSKTMSLQHDVDYKNQHYSQVLGWVIKNERQAGATTDTFPGINQWFIPIGTSPIKGVVAINCQQSQTIDPYDASILESMLNELSLAVENVTLLKQTRESMLQAERQLTHSNFLRSISHDIRTPLTTIMGNLDILMTHNKLMPFKEQHQLLLNSYQESQYLYHLVTNILSLTRLQSSNVHIKLQPYLVSELVEEIDTIIKRRHLKVDVTISLTEDLHFVRIDSKLILQAIFNLIENAIKHSSSNTTIKLCIHRPNDKQVQFSVIDEGPGISVQEQQKIFEPFYTGANKHFKDNQKESMGLGLYLVQTILHKHYSTLQYKMNQPHGSIFYFNIDLDFSEGDV
ncbi:sensor histidine kinase [Staphylococcus schweitzeri]|uniref:histidine kinase n=1 Tax=Staphylococcus schweitzeri TaxID=1654388 RepID=A0A077UK89_9STAP|nr:sensor histidine kinase KdpD [Staphylococcus schweitzeri]CDR28809.1 sensor kinase protein [Staphylococcus schweitzeri]